MSTFTGKTVNDAIQKGLKALKLTQSNAEVNIVQTGRKGFLGIGRRSAKVEVTEKKIPQPKHKPQKIHHESRSKKDHVNNSQPKGIKIKPKKHVSTRRNKKNHRSASRRQRNVAMVKKLEHYLGRIIKLLGINAKMDVTFNTTKKVRINFKTDKEGLLIGKHGLTINALQALSKIYLNRMGFYHLYVELDTADYRQRRMDILGRLAERTAREAVAMGKPVYLDPMPSFERKKIHKTLEDSPHVMTYSAGREPYRAVVVAPK